MTPEGRRKCRAPLNPLRPPGRRDGTKLSIRVPLVSRLGPSSRRRRTAVPPPRAAPSTGASPLSSALEFRVWDSLLQQSLEVPPPLPPCEQPSPSSRGGLRFLGAHAASGRGLPGCSALAGVLERRDTPSAYSLCNAEAFSAPRQM